MLDNRFKIQSSCGWVSDMGDAHLAADLLKATEMMKELIRQTEEIQFDAEKAEPDVLLDSLEKRKQLLERMEVDHERLQLQIEQSLHRDDIKHTMSTLVDRIKQSDKNMVDSIQKRKQQVMEQLLVLNNQSNIHRYIR
jgi:hypothetical protein